MRVLSILSLLAMLSSVQAQTANPAGGNQRVDGATLIVRSRQTLASHASIEAKVRQQINLFDQQLVGNGAYLQTRDRGDTLIRLELKIQTANQISSLLQVADRRYLWTERQLKGQRTVSQVDLRKVQEVRGQAGSSFSQPATQLLAGGLSELLAGLSENFDFYSIRRKELAKVPVYELTGRLSQHALASIFPKQKGPVHPPSLDQLPPQVPNQVMLMLGQDDLFPYVVDFRRQQEGQSSADAGESIVRMQLFEVRIGGAIDPSQFIYKPGAVNVSDETAEFLKAWKRRETLKR